MEYKTKIIVEDSFEVLDRVSTDSIPKIGEVILTESTNITDRFMIGTTAANSLTFNLYNNPYESMEGLKVELYIASLEEPEEASSDFNIGPNTSLDDIVEPVEPPAPAPIPEEVQEAFKNEWNLDTYDDAETSPEALKFAISEDTEAEEVTFTDEENTNYRSDEAEYSESTMTEPVSDETEQWLSMGTFYITSVVTGDTFDSVTALDGFCKMTNSFKPTSGTIDAQFEEFRSACSLIGIEVDEAEMPTTANTWSKFYTLRDAAGYFATFLGGYASFDRGGALVLRQLLQNEVRIASSDLKQLVATVPGGIRLDSVACNKATVGADYILSPADAELSASTVLMDNPMLTQAQLDGILDIYTNLYYQPCEILTNWDWPLNSGDIIECEYMEDVVKVCIHNMSINFANGTARISSKGSTESVSAYESPQAKALNRIKADIVETEQLIANKADINLLNVNTAQITNGVITNLDADVITSGEINADVVNVKNINGNEIKNGSVLAAALSQEAVQTIGGNKVYYQAEQPTGGTYVNGDTWYKTVIADTDTDKKVLHVWNGTTWEPTDFDARILRANTITAQEIAANTIEAGNINMDNLQTNLARIGSEDETHIVIDNNSVDVINAGGEVVATFGEDTRFVRENATTNINANGISISNNTTGEMFFNVYKTSETQTIDARIRLIDGVQTYDIGYDFDIVKLITIQGTTPTGMYSYIVSNNSGVPLSGTLPRTIWSGTESIPNSISYSISNGKITIGALGGLVPYLNNSGLALRVVVNEKAVLSFNNHDITYNGECVSLAGNSGEVTLSTSAANYLTGRCQTWQTSDNYEDVYEVSLNPATIKAKKKGMYLVTLSGYFTTNFTANDIIHINLEKQQSGSTTWTVIGFAGYIGRVTNASWYQRVDCVGYVNLDVGDTVRMTAYNQTGARGRINVNNNTNIQIIKIY